MPYRTTIFSANQYYHIYNKAVAENAPFQNDEFCKKFRYLLWYYRSINAVVCPSHLQRFATKKREDYLHSLTIVSSFRVSVLCYCIMPTHFHLLVRQHQEQGITDYMRAIGTSSGMYYNRLVERTGALFGSRFQSVRIINEPQFTHVSRYIHLNPYSSGVVKTLTELENYPWSSLSEYFLGVSHLCDMQPILKLFGTAEKYKKFLYDRADYQRSLSKARPRTGLGLTISSVDKK